MCEKFELTLCQGKYRYEYDNGKQYVWRNDEPWTAMNQDLVGNKFVFSLAVELDESLKQRDQLQAALSATVEQRDRLLEALNELDEYARGFSVSGVYLSDEIEGARLLAKSAAAIASVEQQAVKVESEGGEEE